MERIFKYKLEPTETQFIKLPVNSKILSVIEQHQQIVLYAIVDDEAPMGISARISIVATGDNIVNNGKFLDTVKLLNGELVFHVFYDY